MKAACTECAACAANIHEALDVAVEPEQRPAVELTRLAPLEQGFVDGAGQRARLVHSRLGATRSGASLAGLVLLRFRSSATCEIDDQPGDLLAVGCSIPRVRHFQAKVSAVVDELAPELTGFPPAVVRVVVAKGEQEPEDQPVEHSRFGPPFDVGQMFDLDKPVHQSPGR